MLNMVYQYMMKDNLEESVCNIFNGEEVSNYITTPGNYFKLEDDTLLTFLRYIEVLLTFNGSVTDKKTKSIFLGISKSFQSGCYLTHSFAVEIMHMIVNAHVDHILYTECVGLITDKLIDNYFKLIGLFERKEPDTKYIGRIFASAVSTISENASKYNELKFSKNNFQ